MRGWWIGGSLLWVLACAGLEDLSGSIRREPVEVAPEAALPPPPGGQGAWLGLVAHETGEDQQDWWSPVHAGAEILAFDESRAWAGVPEGALFLALTASGEIEITFRGVEEIPYGCDGNTSTFATFDADTRPDEGVVWLAERDNAGALVPNRITDDSQSTRRRTWEGPGHGLMTLERTSESEATFTFQRKGKELYSEHIERHLMEGAEDKPIDLTQDGEIDMPYPELMVLAPAKKTAWLVTRRHGHEGLSWTVIELDHRHGEDKGSWMYAYFCAF
ncbi:MAG TPA: hypothetical protein ENK18_05015 [Deltaproteobacteria bacterium]|nr:hypothetical protein [Deltaproteobacteria bacterium]